MSLKELIARLIEGEDLSRDEARSAMSAVMGGAATPGQIGALLVALRMKGETPQEIAGAALAMRDCVQKVTTDRKPLLDTCGTGGDGRGTVNISTAAALVAAGAGVAVAKHGNRSVSSRSGSADVLEALGVNLNLSSEALGHCLDEVGISFLFAPKLHTAMRHAIGPRRELGVRTIFNILGPLTNPAGAGYQVLGVYSPELALPLARVLQHLGTERAIVFHGHGGLDELSLSGPNLLYEVRRGWKEPRLRSLDASQIGMPRVSMAELSGGTPTENAAWLQALLEGKVTGGARETVVLNAAAALVTIGHAARMTEGIEQARESLDSSEALKKLNHLKEFSRGFQG
ncbi:MAG: anthranilate phosphoribosyltransferase [Candidatus Eisenbacteria bacterium]|uniref:Anthranilate phosphoribosyltransferase n=1 Tax=Eiseniibacteriota bacterium TaxID=2212470 RepID=A0A948RWL0_UNCEI|nr:anthranilate phosphoribosyltransferase [Candidatus Eisenbacteria bacterium]MBU1950344.1 anthranilate phosphoribosyltransferase [Candidatus Eisenbacteria bacterium]MBU2690357.1 anthranilate phosphoribosyltransferase [Candidatus Eisenbacteria bacterium]